MDANKFLLSVYRWEVISNFIKQHVPNSNKTAKDVLAKAKELQKNGEITSSRLLRFWFFCFKKFFS